MYLKNAHTQNRRGFTLIELLIVIGLTAVLLSLLVIPLVSAIRFTQQAQIVTAAQDDARQTRERLTREMGSAIFVFDGTSHPFLIPAGTTVAASDDRYTNFLDLPIQPKTGANVIAHAYHAKIDFALPKRNSEGNPVDPTTGEPITYRQGQSGSALVSSPSLVFPAAAGSTMIRYWVGLQDPTKSYNNLLENHTGGPTDNMYVLYRAQFQPYMETKDANGNTTGVQVNTDLFATRDKKDAGGNIVKDAAGNAVQLPEIDDPDFFRYVQAGDINWLSDTHAAYSAAEAATHNTRVDKWIQIAKPVIGGRKIDLILLPHDARGKLVYNTVGVPNNGYAHDPVTNTDAPIVSTSVTFRPATVSGTATPGTTTEYNTQAATSTDQIGGFGYIPTVYTATSQSWALPYHVALYPANYDAGKATDRRIYFDTTVSAVTDTANNYVVAGDVLEYRHLPTDPDDVGTLVYNVTGGYPVMVSGGAYTLGGTDYVPISINPDTGTINFAVPSFPQTLTTANYQYVRQWSYVPVNGVVDLTQRGTNPAESPLMGVDASGLPVSGVPNSHPVPGTVRVFGPDRTPGPGQGKDVPYQEVYSILDPNTLASNQFVVDYAANSVSVNPDVTDPIKVIYDYQANMTVTNLTDPAAPFSAENPYLPMQVKVDYQTRDLIDISLGIRIYDVSTGRAQVIPAQTKIKIGNSNR